ncbi:hypothetical protein JHK82_031417 [Glycine max]|nr:hypothetical protein JHK85_032072 [Glycine max]KAG4994682.1 hypothetical protein JHK86_031509 [Glycine max]KAG5124680.1 hypothetical protein JHK82_031417 [Glycine max]KAG5146100.1 hypothetical protein JHK84_031643 [Glycine max]
MKVSTFLQTQRFLIQKEKQGGQNEIICFECRKPGQMKVECPRQKKKKRYYGDKMKKSLIVTWDDLDNEKSNSSADEQANICLVADSNDKVETMKRIPYDVLL